MTDLTSIDSLNQELQAAILNQTAMHDKMRQMNLFYRNSAFFERQAGQAANKNDFRENLLEVFADKNIEYTSMLPAVKVPTSGSDQQSREAASKREKLIYAVRRSSGMAKLQTKWARDATLSGLCISETYPNLRTRMMEVKRYSPLKSYWTMANEHDDKVMVFWAVFLMSADQCEQEYGVRPTKELLSMQARQDFHKGLDGRDWYTHVIRWDDKTRTKWVGDVFIEEAHQHAAGEMPIDICMPKLEIETEPNSMPGFYLEPLVPLQAELNDVFYRRGRIVRRSSSPVVWVRGVPAGRRLDDVKSEMAKPGGGVLGLAKDGEAGVLTLGPNDMLNDHEDRIILAMTRVAGYGNAAFGESVGANTSGDALGMYFNATQRKIETQWISWIAFHESINAKIFRGYARMLKLGETINVTGYAPAGTIQSITDADGNVSYQRSPGMFEESIQQADVLGASLSVCIPPTAAPRNANEDKRLAIEGVNANIISRARASEAWDVLSPEDEFRMIEQENQSPAINPQGIQQMVQAYTAMNQQNQPPAGSGAPGA